ncbi:hypothetical protein SuNHUV7_23880 (plasmid) [Pseudoseohaeicola sp. NH-UV-7]|uniref:hypothetical protein n=1 Tax=unclassified Sulfitobacter TaxID=196795 RepID=UPI0013B432FC|nr:hypothetical protein [Sulfitobacter sp. JL08]
MLRSIITVALVGSSAPWGAALAQDGRVSTMSGSDWTFTAAPYVWGTGLDGDIGLFGFPAQDVDISFGDVLDNLDMAFMGVFTARNGPYSFGVDLVYSKLGTNIGTPNGIAASDIDVDATTFWGTFYGGYQIVDEPTASVDVIGGIRVWSVENDFRFNGGALAGTSASDGDDWIDPVIGLQFRKDLSENFYVSGWGMVGGFGVSSDLVWDALGVVGYEVSDVTSIIVGYRASGVDYSSGGFSYDTVQQGPIVGAAFRF